MKEKESEKSGGFWTLVGVVAFLICVVILALVINSEPIDENGGGTDQNTTDQNISSSPDQNSNSKPKPTKWCYLYFLHRKPVLKINVNEDGTETKINWQEAEELNYLEKGQEIHMENLDRNGIYCEGAVYYGWKKPYKDICLILEDQDRLNVCLNSPVTDLYQFIDANANDANTSYD